MKEKKRLLDIGFSPAWSVLIAFLALFIDYISGPIIQFPILYLIPVILVTWGNGWRWGLSFAVVMPLVRVAFTLFWDEPWTMWETAINEVVRMIVLSGYVILVDRVAQQSRALQREVKALEGLLPVCGFCKKIRDENGQWQPMESYISQHSDAEFTHTFCPECGREHYGDLVDDLDQGS